MQENDETKSKEEKIIMFGKKEFIKFGENKNKQYAVISRVEDPRTVNLKSDAKIGSKEDKLVIRIGQEKIEIVA